MNAIKGVVRDGRIETDQPLFERKMVSGGTGLGGAPGTRKIGKPQLNLRRKRLFGNEFCQIMGFATA